MLRRPREAARMLGVSTETLRAWHRQGAILATQYPSGHRRYLVPDKGAEKRGDDCEPIIDVVYARVSSQKQRGDLERQVDTLRSLRPGYRIISDVGSGLNFKRAGLINLLDLAFSRRLGNVVVTHRNRLARFGFDLVEHILSRHGAVVTVLHPPQVNSADGGTSELADDLLAIVTVFAARHHGRRSHSRGRRDAHAHAHEKPQGAILSDLQADRCAQPDGWRFALPVQQSQREGDSTDGGDSGTEDGGAQRDEGHRRPAQVLPPHLSSKEKRRTLTPAT